MTPRGKVCDTNKQEIRPRGTEITGGRRRAADRTALPRGPEWEWGRRPQGGAPRLPHAPHRADLASGPSTVPKPFPVQIPLFPWALAKQLGTWGPAVALPPGAPGARLQRRGEQTQVLTTCGTAWKASWRK